MPTNPRITLSLSGVDCHDAVKALASASGRVFTPYEGEALHRKAETSPALADAIERLREPHSFEWTDTPFADCVRDLCRAYPIYYWSHGSRSMILPCTSKENQPVSGGCSPHRWEDDGVQVYASSLYDTSSRTVNFVRGTSDYKLGSLSLRIGCSLPGGEADRIVEMEDCAACDDRGSTITDKRPRSRLEFSPAHTGPLPDEWRTMFMLENVSPEAQSIAWLEADLYEYGNYETGKAVFDLPVSRSRRSVRFWDLSLELTAFEAGENIEEDDKDNDRGPNRHRLRMILNKPKNVRVSTPGDDTSIQPMLLDAEGRPFENAGTAFGGMDFPGHGSIEIEAHFKPRRTSPAQVVLELARKAQPRKRLRFRLENIPLR